MSRKLTPSRDPQKGEHLDGELYNSGDSLCALVQLYGLISPVQTQAGTVSIHHCREQEREGTNRRARARSVSLDKQPCRQQLLWNTYLCLQLDQHVWLLALSLGPGMLCCSLP